MSRAYRTSKRKRKIKLGKPRPSYTSSHPRPVKITYMEGFGPKENSDG